ncbi:MAG TPA: superoxide dismutase [Cu-Zn] SodC [Thermodesulfovibrionales bacterium]|jgi:Cu-Zn family superoxide dismutase|nr:superoxide dismutase [Cu-Zn] SodC [Thermodesulfovibrionales bacterium]
MWRTSLGVAASVLLLSSLVFAEEVVVKINLVNEQGVGKEIGTITASDSKYGMILTPQLSDLTPGLHGFHVHEKPDCSHAMKDGKAVPALAAGGHYDPAKTGKHEGPYGNGHLGDLPPLYVAADGKATLPVLAPRLKVADIRGRSLMIHAGEDNYSDMPAPLGGGGARAACGVVK